MKCGTLRKPLYKQVHNVNFVLYVLTCAAIYKTLFFSSSDCLQLATQYFHLREVALFYQDSPKSCSVGGF